MKAQAIKTRKLKAPKDNLLGAIFESLSGLHDGDVVAISSKIVAIGEGRCVKMPESEEEQKALKEELIQKEAELYLEKQEKYRYSRIFTVYNGIFGSSSGIDESNGNGHFILLPKDPMHSAQDLCGALKERYDCKKLGVVIVDSKSEIMRNGVIGVALGYAGFKALYDYRGKKDINGRELHFERLNVADSIATSATLMMGEGNECTPLAVFSDVPHVVFGDEESDDFMLEPSVSMEDDVYAQFLAPHPWKKGGASIDEPDS